MSNETLQLGSIVIRNTETPKMKGKGKRMGNSLYKLVEDLKICSELESDCRNRLIAMNDGILAISENERTIQIELLAVIEGLTAKEDIQLE